MTRAIRFPRLLANVATVTRSSGAVCLAESNPIRIRYPRQASWPFQPSWIPKPNKSARRFIVLRSDSPRIISAGHAHGLSKHIGSRPGAAA